MAEVQNTAGSNFWDRLFDFGTSTLNAGISYETAKDQAKLAATMAEAQRMQALYGMNQQLESDKLAGIHPAVWVALGVAVVGLFAVYALKK